VAFPVPCGAYALVLSLVLIGWRVCVHRRVFGFPPTSQCNWRSRKFICYLFIFLSCLGSSIVLPVYFYDCVFVCVHLSLFVNNIVQLDYEHPRGSET
jgi:hypothetical protein